MSEDAHLVNRHPRWSRADRERLAGAEVRVLGDVDAQGRLLVEIRSGGLAGEWRRMTEAELVRQETAE